VFLRRDTALLTVKKPEQEKIFSASASFFEIFCQNYFT